VLAHGDAGLQVEGELPVVPAQARAGQEGAETVDGSVQDDLERLFEAEPISTALRSPGHRDRRGQLQHQTAEAIMNSGAHRHGLVAARGQRKEDREQGKQSTDQALASETGGP
jgi:hypothetical protein